MLYLWLNELIILILEQDLMIYSRLSLNEIALFQNTYQFKRNKIVQINSIHPLCRRFL